MEAFIRLHETGVAYKLLLLLGMMLFRVGALLG